MSPNFVEFKALWVEYSDPRSIEFRLFFSYWTLLAKYAFIPASILHSCMFIILSEFFFTSSSRLAFFEWIFILDLSLIAKVPDGLATCEL